MDFGDFVSQILDVLNQILITLVVLSFIVFLWHLLRYTFQSDDPQARQESKTYLVYAFLGLIVITSLWGLVSIFAGVIIFPAP